MRDFCLSSAVRRLRGFTFMELLVVMVIIGVLASIATVSMTARSRESDMRDAVFQFIAMAKEARRTAISLRRRVTFEFTQTTFRWCTVDCSVANTPATPQSRLYRMRNVKVLQYTRAPVIRNVPADTSLVAVAAGVKHYFYFEPDGTMIGYTNDTLPRGITLYFQHDQNAGLRVRVPMLPLVGNASVISSW